MNGEIQFDPVPFDEASKIVADRPVVERKVFDQMIPEIRARSFLISGIEDLKVAQEIRDRIAEIPKGGDWDEIKKEIADKLLGDGGVPWLDEEGAKKRAEILLRHHGFQAYAAAHFRGMDEQREAFPYWQYLSMGDDRVRDSHAKLHGLILPADHPFWIDHYPPWDWGCRCQVVPISQAEYDRTVSGGRVAGEMNLTGRIDEDMKIKREGWTLPETGMKQLETSNRLDEGIGSTVDVASPVVRAMRNSDEGKQAAARAAYQWNPGDLRIPISELHDRYGKEKSSRDVFNAFYTKMQKATYLDNDGTERFVWDWALMQDVRRAAGLVNRRAEAVLVNGKKVEHAVLLDHMTGRVAARVSGTDAHQVDPANILAKAAKNGRKVVLIHNHPSGGIPSPQDVLTAIDWRNIVSGNAVASPRGKVQIMRINKSTPEIEINNLKSRLKEFAERLKNKAETPQSWDMYFTRLMYQGVIEYEIPR